MPAMTAVTMRVNSYRLPVCTKSALAGAILIVVAAPHYGPGG